MNKTFLRLASVASELDARGFQKEAAMIDGVLERMAQAQSPTFAPNALQQWNTAIQGPQVPPAYQTEEAKLIQRYLGWGFDAAKRKGVPAARAALQQHLSNQSPQFSQKVMAEFESKIANQKAFQNYQPPVQQSTSFGA